MIRCFDRESLPAGTPIDEWGFPALDALPPVLGSGAGLAAGQRAVTVEELLGVVFAPDAERWPNLRIRKPKLGKKLDLADKAQILIGEAKTEGEMAKALVGLIAECCYVICPGGEVRAATSDDLIGEDGCFDEPEDANFVGEKLGLSWFSKNKPAENSDPNS